jgi:hypothetical protein
VRLAPHFAELPPISDKISELRAEWTRYPPLQKRHSQFNRALENKLGRAGKSDIGETLAVAVKIDI